MVSGVSAKPVNPQLGKISHVNVLSWGNRFALHQIHGKCLWRRLYTNHTTEKLQKEQCVRVEERKPPNHVVYPTIFVLTFLASIR